MGGYIGAKTGTLVASASDIRGDISATDATPEITLKNTTETDADGTRSGKITFKGEQSGGEESVLAQIQGSHDGASDDEKGDLIFKTNDGNDALAPTERLRINSAGDVLVSSPDPSLTITNTTHEDTDGGREGTIVFKGEQSGGELSTLAEIEASHDGTADDEKGDLIFKTNDGSDGTSPTEAMRIDSAQNVGIGTVAPLRPLHVSGAGDTGLMLQTTNAVDDKEIWEVQVAGNASNHADLIFRTRVNAGTGGTEAMRLDSAGRLLIGTTTEGAANEAEDLTISGTGQVGMTIRSTDSGGGRIYFSDGTSGTPEYAGYQIYSHSDNAMIFGTNATEGLRLLNGGNLEKTGDSNSARIIPQSDDAGYLGQSSHRWQAVYAVNGAIQTSDRNLKTEITNSALGLDFVKALRPVSYKWISGGKHFEYAEDDLTKSNPTITDVAGKRNHYGLIAQEVKEVLGDTDFGGWVSEDVTDENAKQSLRYDQFIAPLIKAVQELNAEIETLKTKVAALEAE